MKIYKCYSCGGRLELDLEHKTGRCIYCGSTQALPENDDDEIKRLLDKAASIRQNDLDFDRATSIYDLILSQDAERADAYWGLVLCKYGILYERDKKTGRWIPTINRAQSTPVSKDDNYLLALQNAPDSAQYSWYAEQAELIDHTLQQIQLQASNTEKYDVFISYKERNDITQERTKDSVLAQNIYNALTKEGYKVFFSRISLESALGSEYEPLIYAALRSAKVMLVVGTSAANIDSPWVKNEWSRFLKLVEESGGEKKIIPCYADMYPEDLPPELSFRQAQNLGKIGAEQDIIHGIEKVIPKNNNPEFNASEVQKSSAETLLILASRFLEDGDWKNAQDYCRRAIETNPNDYRGYWFQILAYYGCRNTEDFLTNTKITDFLQKNNLYTRALSLASDPKDKELLIKCAEHVVDNNKLLVSSLSDDIQKAEAEVPKIVKQLTDIGENVKLLNKTKNELESINTQRGALEGKLTSILEKTNGYRTTIGVLAFIALVTGGCNYAITTTDVDDPYEYVKLMLTNSHGLSNAVVLLIPIILLVIIIVYLRKVIISSQLKKQIEGMIFEYSNNIKKLEQKISVYKPEQQYYTDQQLLHAKLQEIRKNVNAKESTIKRINTEIDIYSNNMM